MVMDIMVGIIFFGSVFLSMRKGFALTVINFIRVVASAVLGILFHDDLRDWLLNQTGLGIWIQDTLQKRTAEAIASVWSETDIFPLLPEIIRKEALTVTDVLVSEGISKLAETLLSILSFLLIVLAVGLVCSILNRIFSKQFNEGFVGFMDWFLGGVLGVLSGMFYVFVFLAVIVPVTSLFMPEMSETLMTSFAESKIAGSLYDNNILLLIFRDFFH